MEEVGNGNLGGGASRLRARFARAGGAYGALRELRVFPARSRSERSHELKRLRTPPKAAPAAGFAG